MSQGGAMSEHQLYELVAAFMQLQYPNVVYRFDLAADLKLTVGQAAKHKKLHPRRGYPDLFIACPADYQDTYGRWHRANGLFLELKKDGEKLYKKDGKTFKTDHIREQAEMLELLRRFGYKADFAIGYEDTIKKIKAYMPVL